MIRIVLFDLGDVLELCDDAGWPTEWATRWAQRAGLSLEQARARLAEQQLQPGCSEQDYEAAWQRALGLDDDTRRAMFADMWDRYCGSANEELFAYVRALRSRVRLGVLSNSAPGARREEERRFRLSETFDPIFYSHELGVEKPDPRVYERVVAELGLPAGEIAFVDNRIENVAAAAALGIHGVHHTDNATTMRALDALLAEEPS